MENIAYILNPDFFSKVYGFVFLLIVVYFLFLRKKFYNYFNAIFQSKENNTNNSNLSKLILLIEIALFSVLILATWDLILVHKNIKDFGQWGDFFGGILNPILTFLTFIGLIITITLQQIELKESREEFKRSADALTEQKKHMQIQSFENTFFKLVDLYNNIIDKLTFTHIKENNPMISAQHSEEISSKGREVFQNVIEDMSNINKFYNSHIPTKRFDLGKYRRLQKTRNFILGHYFRNLYQILKLTHTSEERLNTNFKDYANIIRAQLSSYELVLLFYNCLDGISDNGEFKKLLIHYSFLQHAPIHIENNRYYFFLDNHKILIEKKQYEQYTWNNKSAFEGNSALTRKKQ